MGSDILPVIISILAKQRLYIIFVIFDQNNIL
jgi:hypothetical protein